MPVTFIPTDTPEARAALSQTLRMMGTAGVEMAQAQEGLKMAWDTYRKLQKRPSGSDIYMTPGWSRDRVRGAIIRLRLARVCK